MSDDEQERTTLGVFLWILALVLLVVILPGCASSFQGICGARPLGQTDGGVAVLQVHCEAS